MTQQRRVTARLSKPLSFMRSNALGLLALVVASSGTAFAATQLPDDSVDSDTIVFHGVGSEDLAEGAVSSGKIRTGAVRGRAVKESSLDPDVLQRRVGGQCKAGESIRAIGSDGSVLCELDATGATGAAGGDLTGSYPNPQIAGDAVGADELADNSVSGSSIVDRAIAAVEIALNSLTGAEIDEGTLVAGGDLSGSLAAAQVGESGLTVGGDLSGSVANSQIVARTVGTSERGLTPNARVLQTVAQALAGTGGEEVVQLNSATALAGMTFDDVNDRLVVVTPGYYQISAEVEFASNPNSVRALSVHAGAGGGPEIAFASANAVNGYTTSLTASSLVPLAAGDAIRLTAMTGVPVSTDLSVGRGATLTATWVSPLAGNARPAGDAAASVPPRSLPAP